MNRHRQIGGHAHPALAGAPAHVGDWFAPDEEPKEVREVDPGTPGKCVPAPDAWIDIENLILTIPWISFELYFDKASEADSRQ